VPPTQAAPAAGSSLQTRNPGAAESTAPPAPAVRAPSQPAAPAAGRGPRNGNVVSAGQAPPAPPGIPEPLASSCRAEAQAFYLERIRFKESPNTAAQWVQSDYGFAMAMDPRYLEYQREGAAGNARSSPGYPAQYLFRVCLFTVRLQMLGGRVPQWHPGMPVPSGPPPR
jgi:hypothetical protein